MYQSNQWHDQRGKGPGSPGQMSFPLPLRKKINKFEGKIYAKICTRQKLPKQSLQVRSYSICMKATDNREVSIICNDVSFETSRTYNAEAEQTFLFRKLQNYEKHSVTWSGMPDSSLYWKHRAVRSGVRFKYGRSYRHEVTQAQQLLVGKLLNTERHRYLPSCYLRLSWNQRCFCTTISFFKW